MKRNLLVAAAITAILSGCGGGDEGGSTSEPTDTIFNSVSTGDATSPGNPVDAVRTNAVPTAQENSVPVLVKAPQSTPSEGPAAKPQGTPNEIPTVKAQGTLEIPNTISQGTPSENITKSKQGKPQVTETRQAIDASQQAIIEVAEYAAARNVALLPQQVHQLRNVVKSDNSPEAVAAAVAHAKDVVNVQAAQVAKEEFTASQQTPTPYAVPTAEDNAVPLFVKAKQGKPAIPEAISQGIPNEEQVTPVAKGSAPLEGPVNVPTLVTTTETATVAPTKQLQMVPTPNEDRVPQAAKIDPMAELNQHMSDIGLVSNEGTYNSAAIAVRDIMNQDLRDGKDPQITLERAKLNADRVASQYGLTTPPVLDNNRTPPKPKTKKPSVTPDAVPTATPAQTPVVKEQGTPATVAEAQGVPTPQAIPEAREQGTPVVSQNDPDVNQVKSFKKAKWEAQKGDSFIRNGYAQEGWVTSVGTLPSEMATLAPTLKTTNDVAPAQNIEFGEAPEVINQGKPSDPQEQQDIDYSVVDQASQSYDVPDTLDNDRTPTVMPSVATAPVITEEIIIEQSALLTHVCNTKPVSVADLKNPDTEVQVAAFAFSQAQKQLSDNLAAKGYTQQQYTVRTENGMYAGMYFVHVNSSGGTSYELTFTPPKFSNIDINDRQVILYDSNNIVFIDDNDDVLATFKIDTSTDCDNNAIELG